MKKIALLLLLACTVFSVPAFSQLNVTSGQTALQLAQIIAGPGVSVSNASLSGDPTAAGAFTSGGTNPGLGVPSGVVLSSGAVVDIPGDNTNFVSSSFNLPGDPFLEAQSGETSNDAVILQFDFVPNADFVNFNYVFGSEEYPEFVCSFNDMFAFTIEGVTTPLPQTNIALVPGTNIIVSINSINDDPTCMAANGGQDNSAFYIDNMTGPASQYCSFDGLTVLMTAETPVICGETYTLKLMLSDGGDWSFDSGVFIEENSLTTGNVTIETTSLGGDTMAIEGCGDITVELTLNGEVPTQDVVVDLWLGGWTAEWGIDYLPINEINLADSSITIPAGQNSVSFSISPINDNVAEGLEYIDLIAITSTCGTLDTLRLYINDLIPLGLNMPNDTIICGGNATFTATGFGGGGDYEIDWQGYGVVDTIFPGPTVDTWYYATISDECNSSPATDSVQVILDGGPLANAGFDISVCIGGSAQLNATSNTPNVTYSWDPPLYLDNPNVNNPTSTPLVDIDYELTVTRDDGCVNIDSVSLVLTPMPTADFTLPAQGCINDPVISDYAGNADAGAVYNWNFGNGTALNGTGMGPYSINWNQTGPQDVTLSVFWNGCTSIPVTQQINIIGIPTVEAGPPVSFCSGDGAVIGTMGDPNFNYAWNPIAGVDDPTSPQANVAIPNATNDIATTTYYLIVSDQGCTNMDSVDVTVFPTPTAEFVVPDGECFTTNSYDLTAQGFFGPGATFEWDFGADGFPSTSTDQQPLGVIFNTDGQQTVTLTVTDNGCVSNAFSSEITVYAMPVAQFQSLDLEGCQPYRSEFVNTSVHNSTFVYEEWDFGDGLTSSLNDPAHTFTQSGTFDIYLKVTTPEGCADSITQSGYILVHEKPEAHFRITPTKLDLLNAEIEVLSTAIGSNLSCNYFVDPPGLILNNCDFSYEFDDTLTYSITQYVTTEFGCMDTITDEVKVDPLYSMYIPNGFTPNNDTKNETWRPVGEGFKEYYVWVLDRWGKEMWYSADPEDSWDGKFNGKTLPVGMYVYKVETWDVMGEPHEYEGWFQLFK